MEDSDQLDIMTKCHRPVSTYQRINPGKASGFGSIRTPRPLHHYSHCCHHSLNHAGYGFRYDWSDDDFEAGRSLRSVGFHSIVLVLLVVRLDYPERDIGFCDSLPLLGSRDSLLRMISD